VRMGQKRTARICQRDA